MSGIRLACIYCERTDGDGVATIPDGWTSCEEVQSRRESLQAVPNGRYHDWFTHLGICPNCQGRELTVVDA